MKKSAKKNRPENYAFYAVEAFDKDKDNKYYLLASHWSASSFVRDMFRATFYATAKEAKETMIETQTYKDYSCELKFKIIPVMIKRYAPIVFNGYFWDCNCEQDYIHCKEDVTRCNKCNATCADQPLSRQNEIEDQLCGHCFPMNKKLECPRCLVTRGI